MTALRTFVSTFATGALLASAGALCAQDPQQPPRPQSPQDRAPEHAPQNRERDLSVELVVIEAQINKLGDDRRQLIDEMERTRAVVRMLEEQLRDARLRNIQGEEIERMKAEHDNHRVLLQNQEGQYQQLMDRMAQMEMTHVELRDRIATDKAQREQAAREQDRAAAEARRREAEQQAASIYQDVLALAKQPDSTKALQQAMMQSEVQQLQARYAGLQERLVQLEQLYQRGAVPQTELTEARTQAETVLAEMRQATIRGMMQQMEREREGFAQRNDARERDVTGEVLQTEFFRGYLDTVQRYSALASDPETASVAAVVTAADLLRAQGPQASIEYFEPILTKLEQGGDDPSTRAAQAAVRMQLAEAYHAAGRDPEALNMLRTLIVRGGTVAPRPQ